VDLTILLRSGAVNIAQLGLLKMKHFLIFIVIALVNRATGGQKQSSFYCHTLSIKCIPIKTIHCFLPSYRPLSMTLGLLFCASSCKGRKPKFFA